MTFKRKDKTMKRKKAGTSLLQPGRDEAEDPDQIQRAHEENSERIAVQLPTVAETSEKDVEKGEDVSNTESGPMERGRNEPTTKVQTMDEQEATAQTPT